MRPVAGVLRDEPVRHEIETLAGAGIALPRSEELGVHPDEVMAVVRDPELEGTQRHPQLTEAVVRMFGRPVLFIQNGKIELPRSKELRTRLLPARKHLEARIPSVGRVEFIGHPQPWGGTGWVIDEGVIVTNRHVAELFVRRTARGFPPKLNPVTDEPMSARIDFLEERRPRGGRGPSQEIGVRKVLFVEQDGKKHPDVAFFLLEPGPDLPAPIPVLEADLADDADVAVVGYPAPDPEGVPSEAAAHRIFHDSYSVKRLAPGKVISGEAGRFIFTHDATTLGGNSGSAVLDMETGAAAGLHFSGQLGEANYAVKASALRNALARARSGRKPRRRVPRAVPRPLSRAAVEESTPQEYADREGFDPAFLGARLRVELPVKETAKRDLLTFTDLEGKRSSELRYTHYSVGMSVSRRQCLWSAVNIDGQTSKPDARPTKWLIDPRIPGEAQTLPDDHDEKHDVYGNAPRFARGHMTRREDPIWGDETTRHRGNLDSMHYTNVVPQMQSFNGKIWNNLEDYALQNARKDKMRISVITGPIFADDDPTMFGARIPVEFWKLIAFIHDETGQLTATGYIMSQETDLPHEEFVFAGFDGTHQAQLSAIERRTGLSFGKLTARDPLHGEESILQPLTEFEQIRFT
jgi:endonuclease G, mitochondrial